MTNIFFLRRYMDIDRNNTSFPLYNYERLKGLKWTENDLEMYHQFLVRQYLLSNPRQRGLLVFFQTGWGKTRTGANNIREFVGKRQILVIAPKKVFATFEREFETVGVNPKDVHMISLKANNLTEQVERLPGGPFEAEDTGSFLRHGPIDNTFLIVDEAHNLFNAIVNGGKNAVELYDAIMSARNLKILFLSGTPISNTAFELVPCFNMLAGQKLFPENLEDFEKYFTTQEGTHVKNVDKFKNRIFGLVAYYGDWVQAVQRVHRPTRLPTKVIQVPMSELQYAMYSTHRDKEREERGPMGRSSNERFAPKNSSSTYRIRSRQASNFVPDPTDKRNRGLDNPDRCPKFYRALEIIESHPDQPGIVCSNFVNDSGLRDFAHLLRLQGWEEWNGRDLSSNSQRFAIIAGDVDEEDAAAIQRVASSEDNIRANIIRLVLVGPAGAEGIEFKHFRYDIVLDPFFNAVRTDQFEARIDRYRSHEKLPKAQRTVQPYHLLATYPVDKNGKLAVSPEEVARELTTDNELYTSSKRRKLLALEFYRLMIEASIDCHVHRDALPRDRAARVNCLMCSPTNQPLFTDRLDKDIKAPDPCQPPKVEKIEASEVLINTTTGQKKFMYTRHPDHFDFFEFRTDLGGYIPVARNHKEYDLLVEAVQVKK